MPQSVKRQKRGKLSNSRRMTKENVASVDVTDSIHTLALDGDDDVPLKIRLERNNYNMKQVLQNPLLVHIIMDNSEFPELKVCRLVNQTFKCASTEQILKRDCSNTTLFCKRCDAPNRHPDKNVDQDTYDLRSFNKLLKTSQKYPCTDFTLHILGGQVNIRHLFELIGQSIKTLRIFNSDHRATLDQELLRKILMELAPNVDNLTLHGCQFNWKDKKLILPSLKRFSYAGSLGTSQEIIANAPNLISVDGFWFPSHIDVLDTDKILTVQDLDHVVGDPGDIHRFVGAGCKLRKLHMTNPWDDQEMSQPLKFACMTLIQSSMDTLIDLDMAGLFSTPVIQFPQFPVLKKVETLKLGAVKARVALGCMPVGVSFNSIFPNLKTLNLTRLLCHDDANWDKHFPVVQPGLNGVPFGVVQRESQLDLERLETLIVRDDLSERWMNRFYKHWPNFTRLVVKSELGENIHAFLEKVCRLWTHLQSIQIVVVGLSKPINLDSVFTGLTAQSCNRLRLKETRLDGVDKFRIGPFICDIKGLKTLQIVFYIADSRSASRFMKMSPLTHVSALYAFNLMPNLKVTLSYQYKSPMLADKPPPNLKSIAPYVNLRRKLSFADYILITDSKGITLVRD